MTPYLDLTGGVVVLVLCIAVLALAGGRLLEQAEPWIDRLEARVLLPAIEALLWALGLPVRWLAAALRKDK